MYEWLLILANQNHVEYEKGSVGRTSMYRAVGRPWTPQNK
jgi:hypothetical protein